MELRTNNEVTTVITYSEVKPKNISMKWNAAPKKAKDTRSFWQKHETQIFNGIGKFIGWVAGSTGLVTAAMVIWHAMF